jgi:hypothetical protein
MPWAAQVVALHVGAPHTLGVPPPPHVSGETHVPHWIRLPQPSPAGPHVKPCWAQLSELQVAWYGVTHDETSKSMNSTIAS